MEGATQSRPFHIRHLVDDPPLPLAIQDRKKPPANSRAVGPKRQEKDHSAE